MSDSAPLVTVKTDVVRITVRSVTNKPGVAGTIFTDIARFGFTVDSISQTDAGGDDCDITFTVPESQSELVLEHIESRLAEYGAVSVVIDTDVALLTIADEGISRDPRRLSEVFSALARLDINILAISTGTSTANCLIPRHRAGEAVRAIEQRL